MGWVPGVCVMLRPSGSLGLCSRSFWFGIRGWLGFCVLDWILVV